MAMIDPEKYETYKSVAARDAEEFVPKLVQLMGAWESGQNILDYGCGAGSTGYRFILPQIENLSSVLYSVDISEKMLEFARKNYTHPKIQYAQGDITNFNFPFKDVQFDKIFSIYVLHFLPDIRDTFRNFQDIMKPGGRLAFTVVSKSSYFSSLRVLGNTETWKNYLNGHEDYFPEWLDYEEGKGHESCTKIIEASGFNIIHLEVKKRNFQFSDINTILDFYMSLVPFMDTIPKAMHPQFKEDLRALVTGYAGIPLNSKEIYYEYECVVAVIEKPSQ